MKATVEALATGLGYATFARYDLEDRFGGNPSGNEGVDYSTRISDPRQPLIDTVDARCGRAARRAAGRRHAGAGRPRGTAKALAEGGDPQGTVHGPDDHPAHRGGPARASCRTRRSCATGSSPQQQSGAATADLVQLYTVAPDDATPRTAGAPYGAGHCNFTSQSRVAVIDLLNDWVQNGVYPGSAAIAAAMGDSSGYVAGWTPGPWPRTEQ